MDIMARASLLLSASCVVVEATLNYKSVAPASHDPVQQLLNAPKTLSAIPYARGSVGVDHAARRVEFQTVTVDDLAKAGVFYGDVLGGDELQFCEKPSEWCTAEGYVRFSGDEHKRAMFAMDDIPAQPDISSSGDMEVHSRFFTFQSSMIQLIAFAPKEKGPLWSLRDSHTAATYTGNAHICFWIKDGVAANDWIEDVEHRSHTLGLEDVKFNRPVPQASEADREKVPKDKYANCAKGGVWEGNCAAYFKGSIGEQLEVYAIERTYKHAVGRAFCERGGAGPAFLSSQCKGGAYCNKPQKPHVSQQIHGVFQQGFTTKNIHRSVGFYTEVLGGDLISYPAQGGGLMQSDPFQWQIFGNETFKAWRYAEEQGITRKEALHHFGIPDLSPSGNSRLDLQFILFDNFVVEVLQYSAGLTYGAASASSELNHSSSPAYVTTVSAAFGVGNATLKDFFHSLANKLKRQGYPSLKVPDAGAGFPVGHPYQGLEYAYAKGPDGESLSFVSISDVFGTHVQTAYERSGVVSTLFPETNAFAKGDMAKFCRYATDVPLYSAYELPGVEL